MTLRDQDAIARVGGDEFVVLALVDDLSAIDRMLARARADAGAMCSWSHGWVVWADGEPFEEALARADAAMYDDKRRREHR